MKNFSSAAIEQFLIRLVIKICTRWILPKKRRREIQGYLYNRFITVSVDFENTLLGLGYSIKKLKNGILITGNNLRIFGKSKNTLWTASEVLAGAYEFKNNGEDFVVVDIGLNIGIASLLFAKKDFIKRIYSFEPFEPIFEQAKKNFQENPQLAKKIIAYNYGLSNRNGEITVAYNPERPGSMSTACDRFSGISKEHVTAKIRKTSEVLEPIFDENKDKKIMLKIDCEGGEREILPDLSESGLLERVSVVIMEYHDGIFQPLVELLEQSGFSVKVQKFENLEIGKIDAIRK